MEGYGNENPGAFQSTRPLRGATTSSSVRNIDIRISTHAPRKGRDKLSTNILHISRRFQPTRPLRGATPDARVKYNKNIGISTHAPLAGRDAKLKVIL